MVYATNIAAYLFSVSQIELWIFDCGAVLHEARKVKFESPERNSESSDLFIDIDAECSRWIFVCLLICVWSLEATGVWELLCKCDINHFFLMSHLHFVR